MLLVRRTTSSAIRSVTRVCAVSRQSSCACILCSRSSIACVMFTVASNDLLTLLFGAVIFSWNSLSFSAVCSSRYLLSSSKMHCVRCSSSSSQRLIVNNICSEFFSSGPWSGTSWSSIFSGVVFRIVESRSSWLLFSSINNLLFVFAKRKLYDLLIFLWISL